MARIKTTHFREALLWLLFFLAGWAENPIQWLLKAIGSVIGLFGSADFIISASKPDHWAHPMITMLDGIWPFAKPILQLLVIYFILRLHLEEANGLFARKEQFDVDHKRLVAQDGKLAGLAKEHMLLLDRIKELKDDLKSANGEIIKLNNIYENVESIRNVLKFEMQQQIYAMFNSKQQEYNNKMDDMEKDYTIRTMNLGNSFSSILERVQELENRQTVTPPASPLICE